MYVTKQDMDSVILKKQIKYQAKSMRKKFLTLQLGNAEHDETQFYFLGLVITPLEKAVESMSSNNHKFLNW